MKSSGLRGSTSNSSGRLSCMKSCYQAVFTVRARLKQQPSNYSQDSSWHVCQTGRPRLESVNSCKPVAFGTWASTCDHTPACRQRRKRAYTVYQGPNRSAGKARHDTGQRARLSTASTNKRVLRAVMPGERSWPGRKRESRSHCVSVNKLWSSFILKRRPSLWTLPSSRGSAAA